MTAPPTRFSTALSPMVSRRDLRLASGLVLFGYVTVHLTCHALGLVSLALAETALAATVVLWRSLPGTLMLYGAAVVHVSLALLAVYDRRTLRMPPLQWIRIVLGLVMPISLIAHFVLTRYAFERYGIPGDYARVVGGLWGRGAQGLSFGLLAPGWVHGCLGLRFAFGHRPLWQRLRPALFAVALLLPVLAALGFVTMGRQLTEHPPEAVSDRPRLTALSTTTLAEVRDEALAAYACVIALVVFGRFGRRVIEQRRRSVVWLTYPGRRVSVPRGWSVLDASRSFGIDHQAACGGRGRCTTCRVRVIDGAASCPSPTLDERRALGRISSEGSAVRLACQLRPTGDITIEPLLTVASPRRSVHVPPTTERLAVVLRFSVQIASDGSHAPHASNAAHDTLHALRACVEITQRASTAVGGTVCNRSDANGVIVFEAGRDASGAVWRAVSTADDIGRQLSSLAMRLSRELDVRLAFTLALDIGPVVVGSVHAASHVLAALGGAVDEADRLVHAASHDRCVMSVAALRTIGLPADDASDLEAGRVAAWLRLKLGHQPITSDESATP